MAESLSFKNSFSPWENYIRDFSVLFNKCGGYSVNSFYPVDFILKSRGWTFYIEAKECHSLSKPFYNLDKYFQDEHLKNQIDFLFQVNNRDQKIAGCFWLYLSNWKDLALKAPFLFINAHILYQAVNSPVRKAGNYFFINLLTHAKPISLYALLTSTPLFKQVFADIPVWNRPYLNYQYPDIKNYEDKNFSLWKE